MNAPRALTNETACNITTPCTGPNNFYIRDEDGNLTTFTTMFAPSINNLVNNDTSVCTDFGNATGLYTCTQPLTQLYFENKASDLSTRKTFPISLVYDVNKTASVINGMKLWPGITYQLPRFLALVALGKTYTMTFPVQPPDNMWYRLQRRDKLSTGNNA